jgi:hypothetical protein
MPFAVKKNGRTKTKNRMSSNPGAVPKALLGCRYRLAMAEFFNPPYRLFDAFQKFLIE